MNRAPFLTKIIVRRALFWSAARSNTFLAGFSESLVGLECLGQLPGALFAKEQLYLKFFKHSSVFFCDIPDVPQEFFNT